MCNIIIIGFDDTNIFVSKNDYGIKYLTFNLAILYKHYIDKVENVINISMIKEEIDQNKS